MDAETIQLVTTLIGENGKVFFVIVILCGSVMLVFEKIVLLWMGWRMGLVGKLINAVVGLRDGQIEQGKINESMMLETERMRVETERMRDLSDKLESRLGND